MGWIVLLILLGLTALAVWHHMETKRREREAAAEANRRGQVFAFARTLGTAFPPGIIPSLPAPSQPLAGGSWDLTERLLDDLDAVTGPVIGTVAAHPQVSWPFVAARHEDRDRAPERTVGESTVPVILPDALRARHLYVAGKSGSGKTTLIQRIALQDMAAGAGVGVIAPEAELIHEELLPFLPEERLDDVVYINPADTTRPVPINPLHIDAHEDLDLRLDETLSIFHRLIAEDGTGAPRMETILRFSLFTLMSLRGATLLDIPRLLDRTDDTFRRFAIEHLDNEEVRHFWTSVYPSFPKDAHLSLLNRLGRFLQPKVVRSILCQPGASLNVRAAMDAGRIILANLSDGILGEQNAQLLGQLIVAKFQTAAMSRADVPKAARRRFYLFVDEFQAFCGVAGTSYERILSRARKYGLSLVLAHQQTGQVPEPVMREILGNVGSLAIFRVGASDARRLGHELDGVCPGFAHRTLTSLAVGRAACLFDQVFTFATTTPPPRGGSARIRDEAIRRSRERFGVSPRTTARTSPASALDALTAGDVFAS